jgi:hypothetical protein
LAPVLASLLILLPRNERKAILFEAPRVQDEKPSSQR